MKNVLLVPLLALVASLCFPCRCWRPRQKPRRARFQAYIAAWVLLARTPTKAKKSGQRHI